MPLWQWLVSLSPHELDALRTIAFCVGSGAVPVLTFLVGWAVKLLRGLRHEAKATAHNTAWTEYVDGEPRTVSVAGLARDASEEARRARFSSEAGVQETRDLGAWVKGTGRRRQPTGTVDMFDIPTTESRYVGAESESEYP